MDDTSQDNLDNFANALDIPSAEASPIVTVPSDGNLYGSSSNGSLFQTILDDATKVASSNTKIKSWLNNLMPTVKVNAAVQPQSIFLIIGGVLLLIIVFFSSSKKH